MAEESAAKKLEKYKEKVRDNVSVLIEKTFPEKILELNELLESEKLSINRLDTIHVSTSVQLFLGLFFEFLADLKNQPVVSLCVTHIFPFCG